MEHSRDPFLVSGENAQDPLAVIKREDIGNLVGELQAMELGLRSKWLGATEDDFSILGQETLHER